MKKFVYVDASASWLKPQSVVETETDFLVKSYANAGRGICERAEKVDALLMNQGAQLPILLGLTKKISFLHLGQQMRLTELLILLKIPL